MLHSAFLLKPQLKYTILLQRVAEDQTFVLRVLATLRWKLKNKLKYLTKQCDSACISCVQLT